MQTPTVPAQAPEIAGARRRPRLWTPRLWTPRLWTPRLWTATPWAAVAGVVSALLTLAVAEVVSLVMGGAGNPVLAVGSLIIDLVPPGFRTVVIELFDTADKLVLFICIGALVLALAIVAGILEWHRAAWGRALLGVVALVALLAVMTRADAGLLAPIPTFVGAMAGLYLLPFLIRRLSAWQNVALHPGATGHGAIGAAGVGATAAGAGAGATGAIATDAGATGAVAADPGGYERRGFLRILVGVGAASVITGIAARATNAATAAARAVRNVVTLPAAASAAPPLSADATLDVPGLTPFITPNDEFYRIDTALQVPSIAPESWRLKITGMVEQEIEVDLEELLAFPLQERIVTLACVSNEVGGDLIGNASWLGYPIRELLARARPTADADMVLSSSIDGFTASTPLDVLTDENTDALLAVGMNGEPLPLEHGFPVRMVVPGLYGYVSATKWVVELRVTRFADEVAYWTPRGWSERGPIKLSSRIDTPAERGQVEAGRVVVAGVAWAQHTGVSKVQVRVDDGPWRDAALARALTVDTWIQWSFGWDATSGDHVVTVRATDSDGAVQTSDEAPPAPDGSTGLHSITVLVT